uniref:histidine kinase n=1 Tax=Magnetococcus massalia (strain MO-1) TaxID=451514 RepID=A0A1S7LH05_MAGMO|nr:Putative sensory histidine kinase in two-component regulatory system with NarP (NarL) [Candidatus Magnetococcus massalia]
MAGNALTRFFPFWRESVPLSLKILVLLGAVGVLSWGVLDHLQDRWASRLFTQQLEGNLDRQFNHMLAQLKRYLRQQKKAAQLFAEQRGTLAYLQQSAQKGWLEEEEPQVQMHSRRPPWLPSASILRNFTRSASFFLLDGDYRLREGFSNGRRGFNASLLTPDLVDYLVEGGPSSITQVEGVPLFISASTITADDGQLLGVLALILPLDGDFLVDFHREFDLQGVQVFIDERTKRVLSSSDPFRVVQDTTVEALERQYLIIGHNFFNYEFSSEMTFQVAYLMGRSNIALLHQEILKSGRAEKMTSAMVLISAFFLILFWLSRKLRHFSHQIEHFSEASLGVQLDVPKRGDQLFILQIILQRFSQEITKSREGLTQELVERRKAEARLRVSEHRYRTLLENVTDWVWELDESGRFSYCSPRITALLGYAPDELLGKQPFELIAPEEAGRAHQVYDERARERWPLESFVSTMLHRDGERRVILETNGVPFNDETGRFRGYQGISRDITEKRTLEERLRHFKNQLEIEERGRLGNLLHESIGQSLQAIKLGLEMKSSRPDLPSDLMKDEVAELQDAIGQLRDVTTVLRPSFLERMDLEEAVSWWCRRLSRNWPGEVDVECEGDFAGLDFEIQYNLFRILQESLTNAIKHAGAGRLTIRLSRLPREGVVLRVADDGCGMAIETTRSKAKGLGLSIIQEQADRLGGKAQFESTLGQGLAITVKVPE